MIDAPELFTAMTAVPQFWHLPILYRALENLPWRITAVCAKNFPSGEEWARSARLPLFGDWDRAQALFAIWDGEDDRTGRRIEDARQRGWYVHVHRTGGKDSAMALRLGLEADGFSVRVLDGKLLVQPIAKLTPERRKALQAARQSLIDLIEEDRAWEERADLLAKLVPEFEDEYGRVSPVRLAQRMLWCWEDRHGNPEVMVWDERDYTAFVAWAEAKAELVRAERAKAAPKRPAKRGQKQKGESNLWEERP